MNHGPQYIPFHIVNRDGVMVPAKYIKVKMTNDPYAYGMINSTGEVYKRLVMDALFYVYFLKLLSLDMIRWHVIMR